MVTSSRNKVRQVLNAEAESLSEGVGLINQYLETVDRCCGYRFKWSEIKGQLRFPHVDEWMSTNNDMSNRGTLSRQDKNNDIQT